MSSSRNEKTTANLLNSLKTGARLSPLELTKLSRTTQAKHIVPSQAQNPTQVQSTQQATPQQAGGVSQQTVTAQQTSVLQQQAAPQQAGLAQQAIIQQQAVAQQAGVSQQSVAAQQTAVLQQQVEIQQAEVQQAGTQQTPSWRHMAKVAVKDTSELLMAGTAELKKAGSMGVDLVEDKMEDAGSAVNSPAADMLKRAMKPTPRPYS